VAPPDVPPDRAKALQTAFMAMTRDPAFVAEIGKMGQDLSPIDGDAVRRIIAQMGATPKDVIAQFNEIVAPRWRTEGPTTEGRDLFSSSSVAYRLSSASHPDREHTCQHCCET